MLKVAHTLCGLAGSAYPLIAGRLRGGTPREDDWARTPVQPTILCSTVDQVGSQLLFRGYGVSDAMKPIHAGLIGSDCLILLDEAHLSEPFRQTLVALKSLRSPDQAPFGFAILTATPTVKAEQPFALSDADREHPTLSRRLDAKKEAHLVEISGKHGEDTESQRAEAIAREATSVLARLQASGIAQPAVGVVVNRVARARAVFERLRTELKASATVILLIGPARAVDRDEVAKELAPIRTSHPEPPRQLRETLIVVATQTIEAGVDIDLDGLVTEAAALDALRQRFGRLNRAGRSIVPEAVVVAHKEDLGAKADPVYEDRIKKTWEALKGLASRAGAIDFGVQVLGDRIGENAAELAAPVKDAPILMPAYADLWSQTSPIPNADAEVALFLHGPDRSPAAVQIVWRADVYEQDDLRPAMGNEGERARLIELFKLVPPRAAEAIEVPLWALRAWFKQAGVKQADFSDTVERGREEEHERRAGRCAFRWAGEDSDHTGVVYGSALRNGDLIVVPADYGGSDQWGWHPHASDRVTDVAEKAAWPYHARRFAVRVTPELIAQEIRQQRGGEDDSNANADGLDDLAAMLGQTLGDHGEERSEILLDAVLALKLPLELKTKLEMLRAQGRRRGPLERKFAYGGEPARGVIFIAPRGLKPNGDAMALSATPSTETEELGAASDRALDLASHCKDVHAWAAAFARDAGLPPPVAGDVGLAGLLHDLGKADPRYQAYYAGGTPYGPDAERALAKSGQVRLPPGAWERAGLPPHWRHEALSVRLRHASSRFQTGARPRIGAVVDRNAPWPRPTAFSSRRSAGCREATFRFAARARR